MSVFVLKVDKSKKKDVCVSSIQKTLPDQYSHINEIQVQEGVSLVVFSYDVAFEREVFQNECSTVLIQGYGDKTLEQRFISACKGRRPLDVEVFPEAFCGICVYDDCVFWGTSFSGVDPLFYVETDTEVLITNKINTLHDYIDDSFFDHEALAWIAGRGYINDFKTYWSNVKRVRPGFLYSFLVSENKSSVSWKEYHFKASGFSSRKEISDKLAIMRDSIWQPVDSFQYTKRLWLSGGKDSRAILGYLGKNRQKDLQLRTRGELYSPDVMAAQDLVKAVGLEKDHQVNLPKFAQNELDIFSRLAEDLYWCFVGSSMHDLKAPRKVSSLLVIGGHENGFKSAPNNKELNEFIDSKRGSLNRFSILTNDWHDRLFDSYRSKLGEALKGVPVSRYSSAETILFRNPNYLASALSLTHLMVSEYHPFLDGRFFKLLMEAGDDVLASQYIHFKMMQFDEVDISSLPFAADDWPSSLYSLLSEEGTCLPCKQPPYRFNPMFPAQKSFGVFPWRLELVKLSRNFVLGFLKERKYDLDFIDIDRVYELSKKSIDDFKLPDIALWLTLLKLSLVLSLGKRILLYDKIQENAEVIKQLLLSHDEGRYDFSGDTDKDIVDKLEANRKDLEKCVASLVRENRSREASLDDSLFVVSLIERLLKNDKPLDEVVGVLSPVISDSFSILKNEGIETISVDLSQDIVLSSSSNPKQLIVMVESDEQSPLEVGLKGFSYSKPLKSYYKYIKPENGVVYLSSIEGSDLCFDFSVRNWLQSDNTFYVLKKFRSM